MDTELQRELDEVAEYLRKVSAEQFDASGADPVVKMMLTALVHEAQTIKDEIGNTPQRIAERYCADFIPRDKVCAMPAIALLRPEFKAKAGAAMAVVEGGTAFTYKTGTGKKPLTYLPLLRTALLPHSDIWMLTHDRLAMKGGVMEISTDRPNEVWMGIITETEVECLEGLSMLIKGTGGVTPEHIYIGVDDREMDFATMSEMGNATMLEPFDAQQASGPFFSIVSRWRDCLTGMDDAALVYITDPVRDRDLFKPRPYPRQFRQWLEDPTLDSFKPAPLWIGLDFPEGYAVPDTLEIVLNVLPVVNVEVNSLTLTSAAPIAKLQKHDGAFFLSVIETSSAAQKQGFAANGDDIIVRDYDAECYNNANLYRDVRNLYNKFIDNYYAFVEYNGIKDGEVLKRLRETINRLGKSVGEKNQRYDFSTGTYVMKNMNQFPQTSATKVTYASTQGSAGNAPKAGEKMENRKLPAIKTDVDIIVAAMGGTDKATADQRYELLRYYALTGDRLYTRMDVDAFLRKEIMAEFGKDEFRRIFIKTSIGGTGGEASLVRGLYIDIEFKDRKNYDKAVARSFDALMTQRIRNRSCIAMPIIVTLKNLEGAG